MSTKFNDKFILIIGAPIVLAWVLFACYIIWAGMHNQAVLDNLDGYTTLIAIIGGPALLIIKDALDMWKQQQTAEIQLIPSINAHNMELVSQKKSHELQMDRFTVTGTETISPLMPSSIVGAKDSTKEKGAKK